MSLQKGKKQTSCNLPCCQRAREANINQFTKYKHHNPAFIVGNHSVGLNRIKTFALEEQTFRAKFLLCRGVKIHSGIGIGWRDKHLRSGETMLRLK